MVCTVVLDTANHGLLLHRYRGVMLKLRTSLLSVLLLCLAAPVMEAQEDARLREDCRRIAGSIMTGNSLDTVRYLTDTIGPRLVGSPGSAILLPNSVPNNVLGDWVDTANARGTVLPLPVAEIGLEDNLLLRRHLKQGDVTVQLEIENRVTGPVRVDNVIGEILGREKPDEWVLVGAHLDSWDLGTGAQDNATGSVMVLEAARSIAALPRPPRRSIRFALWAGEEPGIPGSAVYVQAHRDGAEKLRSRSKHRQRSRPSAWLEGRARLTSGKSMQPISERFLKELSGDGLSSVVDCGSDHCPFLLKGIPALNLWVDTSLYWELHHKGSDTFEKIDPLHFKSRCGDCGCHCIFACGA